MDNDIRFTWDDCGLKTIYTLSLGNFDLTIRMFADFEWWRKGPLPYIVCQKTESLCFEMR